MKFHSAISERRSVSEAVSQVVDEALAALGGKIDVAFAFATGDHVEHADAMLENLWLELDPQCLLGCSAEGVIGGDREVERSPGLALLVGNIPDVRLHPFHIAGQNVWRQVLSDPDELRQRVGLGPETRSLLTFGDPFTTPLNQLLIALDTAAPGVPVVGGMASSASRPGENVLLRNDQALSEGLVGLSIGGPVRVETVLSQGCRPIGNAMVVTKAHGNTIDQLGGRPALEALREVVGAMTEPERLHLRNGLFVGLAISEYRERFGRGDFLVRNVLGVAEESGSIEVADQVRIGQTVQFHARDAVTADEDLSMLLDAREEYATAAGALLFSCNGRGTRMFDKPGHDVDAAHRSLPGVPVAGFFAAGEIGPVGGRSFVHGHTASFALLLPPK